MRYFQTLGALLATASTALALDCEGSVACGISLIPGDCTDAANSIDENADYQPGTRIRMRTCLIEYTCDAGNPIHGSDLKGYFESVTSSCSNTCGNIEPSTCPGGQVSIDYTTVDRRRGASSKERSTSLPLNFSPLDKRDSHNNCDGSSICGNLAGVTNFADDCNAAINAIDVNSNVVLNTELSVGNCFMEAYCDADDGCNQSEVGGDVVQGACGRAFHECGNGCGSRTISGSSSIYCRVDYRAN